MKTVEKLDLSQFYGTEHYYKHLVGNMVYTDGVKYFAEKAGAYWFLDTVGFEYGERFKNEEFLSITLTVAKGKAKVLATDGNDRTLDAANISFTDCPEGEFNFYLTNPPNEVSVLMLRGEY